MLLGLLLPAGVGAVPAGAGERWIVQLVEGTNPETVLGPARLRLGVKPEHVFRDAMRGFADALGLGSVAVIAERAEILGRDPRHRERYDIVTARACASMPVLVEYALPLIRAGGSLLAWKGALTADDDEIRTGAAAAQLMGGGTPSIHGAGMGSLGTHRLVVVEKDRATPAGYPRRPGEPARRPLAH